MDIKTKLLLNLMQDNNYFKNLNSYLREMLEEDKLSYGNLKYLYKKLYIGKSLFVKQNIFPVSQFLIKGYSTDETEKLAKLLPDAWKKNVFCYNEKEKGYIYNKLFMDLEFIYTMYDYYKNLEDTKDRAYDIVKDEIISTVPDQRCIEMQIKNDEFRNKKELEDAYNTIHEYMETLRKEFEENTSADKKLEEYFKNDDPVDRYKDILVAGAVLGKIQLRNLWRENGKLKDEKEEFPYNEEQIKMIDKYNRFQNTIDKLEYYAEYVFDNEEEFE